MMTDKKLIEEASIVVAEVDRTHRYSMSKIYSLYNRVYNTNEEPQACTSCLIRKVRALREWLDKQEPETEVSKKSATRKKTKIKNDTINE